MVKTDNIVSMLQLPVYQFPASSNQFSLLKFLSSVISYSPFVAWGVAGLIGLFFIILSAVLSYHWRKFEIDKLVIGQASIIYFCVASSLFVIMIISLAVYLGSI